MSRRRWSRAALLAALLVAPLAASDLPVLGRIPRFALTDQSGRRFDSASLAGRVWVADFVFTSCPDVCTLLTREMARLQQELARSAVGARVRLLSLSVDPERDTPARLAEYAQRHGAEPQRWSFLTGGRDEIWQLASAGFRLPVGDNPAAAGAPILHSGKFVLVDHEGSIRGYYDALGAESRAALGEAVIALAAAAPELQPAAGTSSAAGPS
jgi:protein SCO1/2